MTFVPSFLEVGWRGRPRRAAAWALRRSALALARWSRRLSLAQPARVTAASLPLLEFHAEAGAPEGALYVDGVLFGRVEGVTRL